MKWFFIAMAVQCWLVAPALYNSGFSGAAWAYLCYGAANIGFFFDLWSRP